MNEPLGISEVKAKFAAVCDCAARGEVIRFTRRRGSKVESFELRRVTPAKRQLGGWRHKFSKTELDSLTAPMTDEERSHWNI
jgi:hypothetical protein